MFSFKFLEVTGNLGVFRGRALNKRNGYSEKFLSLKLKQFLSCLLCARHNAKSASHYYLIEISQFHEFAIIATSVFQVRTLGFREFGTCQVTNMGQNGHLTLSCLSEFKAHTLNSSVLPCPAGEERWAPWAHTSPSSADLLGRLTSEPPSQTLRAQPLCPPCPLTPTSL